MRTSLLRTTRKDVTIISAQPGRRVLIGGGWGENAADLCYHPFLAAAAKNATSEPTVGCLVIDEGDGAEYATRFADVLLAVAPCRPQRVLIRLGDEFDPVTLDSLDGLLVCGGLTPAYAVALRPAAPTLREWVAAGHPYAGFSAGSSVAAATAIVGGYRRGDRVVCPPDAGEDLDEITTVDGLGLVSFAVDVHVSQWGTLGRLCAAVADGQVPVGIGIDEDTALVIDGDTIDVTGLGAAHIVTRTADAVTVRSLPAGTKFVSNVVA